MLRLDTERLRDRGRIDARMTHAQRSGELVLAHRTDLHKVCRTCACLRRELRELRLRCNRGATDRTPCRRRAPHACPNIAILPPHRAWGRSRPSQRRRRDRNARHSPRRDRETRRRPALARAACAIAGRGYSGSSPETPGPAVAAALWGIPRATRAPRRDRAVSVHAAPGVRWPG